MYTLQRFAHFSPQDSIASVDSRTAWCLRDGWPRHSLSEALTLYSGQTIPNLQTHYLLIHLFKSFTQLTQTMLEPIIACGCTRKFLAWIDSVPFEPGWWSIGESHGNPGISKKTGNHWIPQVPQSTQMCIKVATLCKPLINNLTSVMDITQTQSISTSITCQYKHNVEVTPKGLIIKQDNRFNLIYYFPIPTC